MERGLIPLSLIQYIGSVGSIQAMLHITDFQTTLMVWKDLDQIMRTVKEPKLCLVSSSGGHWEQLQKLKPLIEKYDGFLVTEKTQFRVDTQYYMIQTDLKDKLMLPKMLINGARAVKIWIKEKPDFVITTGTMVAYPFYLLAVLFHKRFIFIETFGRANMPTVAGKLMEKHSDLFIVQWESQIKHYKKAVYGGCLY